MITAILYLEETTVENGCTWLIPSSHFLPFIGLPNNGGTWMDEHAVFQDMLDQAVPVPMPEGGILFFDSLVFHKAGINQTNKTRISIAMAYHSADELSSIKEDPKRLTIRGSRIYRGNDRVTE